MLFYLTLPVSHRTTKGNLFRPREGREPVQCKVRITNKQLQSSKVIDLRDGCFRLKGSYDM